MAHDQLAVLASTERLRQPDFSRTIMSMNRIIAGRPLSAKVGPVRAQFPQEIPKLAGDLSLLRFANIQDDVSVRAGVDEMRISPHVRAPPMSLLVRLGA